MGERCPGSSRGELWYKLCGDGSDGPGVPSRRALVIDSRETMAVEMEAFFS